MRHVAMAHLSRVCEVFFLLLLLLSACSQAPLISGTPTAGVRKTPVTVVSPTVVSTVTTTSLVPTATATAPVPTQYSARVLLRGFRPDDLAFDRQGRILFSDEIDGLIGRLNADGSIIVLLRDSNGPEGLYMRTDGSIIFAEQETNRIMSLAAVGATLLVLRTLPGVASSANCKHGVDGIAFDPTTDSMIIPDSPTNNVYRMSMDGKTLTLFASGITRPVGASVDAVGNVYIADECGNAIWRIASTGTKTRIGGFGMPDDVVPDNRGNLFVIDLAPTIHSLVRLNLATNQRVVLARQGYIEPQGLLVDSRDDIYVSDDYANMIVEYVPVVLNSNH